MSTPENAQLAEFATFLYRGGYQDVEFFDDNRQFMAIFRYMFTHAIIIGDVGNDITFKDRWCYKDYDSALAALQDWDGVGEPEGWHRHPLTGRRHVDEESGEVVETINP